MNSEPYRFLGDAKQKKILQRVQKLHPLLILGFVILFGHYGLQDKKLSHEVYVWQRHWDESLSQTLYKQGADFDALHILSAEVSWQGQKPVITRPTLAYETLKKLKRPIGLVVRVNAYQGDYAIQTQRLADLAKDVVDQARTAGIAVSELQWDYDAPSHRLEDYRIWLQAIQRSISPLPLVFTALPDWLKQPSLLSLIKSGAGFVLQLHGLNHQSDRKQQQALFDLDHAREWINQAEDLGISFRIALPTYSYRLIYTPDGRLHSVVAEAQQLNLPSGFSWHDVHTDPKPVADMVAELTRSSPRHLQGIIWFRMPTPNDQANWTWSTLQSVMSGHAPESKSALAIESSEPGLYQIILKRDEVRATPPALITVTWQQAHLIAADGLNAYSVDAQHNQAIFQLNDKNLYHFWSADRRLIIGWMRFDRPIALQVSHK